MPHFLLAFIKIFTLTFVTLFPVVNPIGDAPIFLSLTRRYPESVQKLLAKKIAIYGFVILAVSLLFGSEILAFFGVTLLVVQIAGGLIVASTGWKLLNQEDPGPTTAADAPAPTLEDAMEHAFYPLTLPITVGPGCISIAITIGAHVRQQAGIVTGYRGHFVAALVAMAVICLLVLICYGNADRLVRILGTSGTNILTRLSAFILLAIGIQLIWNGLKVGVPELLGR
jgi:multiple antibiotic resistance protein